MTTTAKGSSRKVGDLIDRYLDDEAKEKLQNKIAVHSAGLAVKKLRMSRKLSQEQLAALVGTTQGAISDIERGVGTQGPTIALLDRIFTACGQTLTLSYQPMEVLVDKTAALKTAAFNDIRARVQKMSDSIEDLDLDLNLVLEDLDELPNIEDLETVQARRAKA